MFASMTIQQEQMGESIYQMDTRPIIVEQAFHSTIQLVWEAITDPAKMRQWFFEQIGSFKAEVGFYTEFDVAFDGKHFVHKWKVTDVLPQSRIAYNWRYEGYSGDSHVIWELVSEGNQTKLKLTVEGLETFPQDVPEFTRESCIQGWTFFLGERLKKFLENPSH
jgi:uncharacterized protein YndB with AHSA1/START domain